MSVDHYENFPVASVLLPKALRPAVRDIYRFARSADDIADEGDYSDAHRLESLDNFRKALDNLASSAQLPPSLTALSPVFTPLQATIVQHQLSYQPFYDLLSAFEQDVGQKRYSDYAQLRDYCRRSADPVGRLMLALFKADTPQHIAWGDAICSALQLINFWQDVAIDWDKDRVYIPQDLLAHYGLSDSTIGELCNGQQQAATHAGWQQLMTHLHDDTRQLLLSGAPLVSRLPFRFAMELKFIILGGLRILERLQAVNFDVFQQRPTLGKSDWAVLCLRGLRPLPQPHSL